MDVVRPKLYIHPPRQLEQLKQMQRGVNASSCMMQSLTLTLALWSWCINAIQSWSNLAECNIYEQVKLGEEEIRESHVPAHTQLCGGIHEFMHAIQMYYQHSRVWKKVSFYLCTAHRHWRGCRYAQTHGAFTLCSWAIIPIFFTLLKLLNDGKALLSTPQQSAAGFKKTELMTEDARLAWCKGLMLLYPRQPSSGMIKTVSIIIQMRREVNKLGVKASAVSCLVTLTGSKHQCWWRLIYFFYSRQWITTIISIWITQKCAYEGITQNRKP